MNYRHMYHAGGFSDVLKHVIWVMLLNSLQQKESAFCILDTHAGIGLYDLNSTAAHKTAEFQEGIALLNAEDSLEMHALMPIEIQQYLNLVKKQNASHSLESYPGSPLLAEHFMREQDQMILCEWHPEDKEKLSEFFARMPQIAIHHMNGYLAMKAFLPPKLKRGVVLIDPPFEQENEFSEINKYLQITLKHWRMGMYMIWYPIKNLREVSKFYQKLKQSTEENKLEPALVIEFHLHKKHFTKLNACGIVVINPPWKLQSILTTSVLPFLEKVLNGEYCMLKADDFCC